MTNRQVPRRWGTAAVVAMAVFAAFVAGTTAQQRTEPIQITVTGVDDAANIATLKLTNRSGRAIVAWEVAVFSDAERIFTGGEDLYDADRRLAADGETTVGVPRAEGVPSMKVSAVFEDRTGAGDEAGVIHIFARRVQHRDALAAWVRDLKDELAKGTGVGGLRNLYQARDSAKDVPATLGLNRAAAEALEGTGSPAEVRAKLNSVLQRAERKLALLEAAAVRNGGAR
jgi:hypothetical protein